MDGGLGREREREEVVEKEGYQSGEEDSKTNANNVASLAAAGKAERKMRVT